MLRRYDQANRDLTKSVAVLNDQLMFANGEKHRF
jgi:hypothetical protein